MVERLKYVTFDDAVEIVGLSPTTVRKLIKAGKIRTDNNQHALLLSWEDICQVVREQRASWSLLTDELADGTIDPTDLFIYEPSAKTTAEFEADRLEVGNCIEWMRKMPSNFVQTVVTSPPYWGVRRYKGEQEVTWADGMVCAFGAEPTAEDYVRHTMEILRHLKRILRDDGVIWWNMGDTYQTRTHIREGSVERLHALVGRRQDGWKSYPHKRYSAGHDYLKDKDLTLVPFHVAIGAQHLGYWVRSVIVWSKENTVPEPVRDRPTTSHEYIFMLVKSRFYHYKTDEGKEQATSANWGVNGINQERRNWRTVWKFPTVGTEKGNHTAAFPEELPSRCITVSSSHGDVVFDPFAGSGTTLLVAQRLGRRYFGCDLSAEYVEDARQRLDAAQPSPLVQIMIATPGQTIMEQQGGASANGHGLERQLPLLLDTDT